MSCNEQPQIHRPDDQYFLFLASKSGTAALILSSSAKALPPAGAAFAQGLGLGVAANARIPASAAAGASAMINGQSSNSVVAVVTFNPEAMAITGGIVQTLAITAAIIGTTATGPLAIASALAISTTAGLNLLSDPAMQVLLQKYGIDIPNLHCALKEKVEDLYNRAKSWSRPRDPIILVLDGDSLETVGLASNVYFDHDSDGVLTKTGWAGKDDALLVWNCNANGRIDTGAELFGDFTVLPNGTLAPNGFAALAALDANGDGILNASDLAFAELKLWRDTSQDGQTGSGELISLADAGIVSLDLAHTLKNQPLANGNTLSCKGHFTRTDGTTSAMGEFKLAIDTFDTRFAAA